MRDSFALFAESPWNWVSVGMAGVIRTNISRIELEATARLLEIAMTPRIYADVRVMETAALSYWSSKR